MQCLIIQNGPESIQAGLMFDHVLMEYHQFYHNEKQVLGDIRLGEVVRVEEGMGAIFVNIGEPKPAFMSIRKEQYGKFKPGMELLVQLKREAYGAKGMGVTDRMSLTGQYVVLTPNQKHLAISAKIYEDNERRRLQQILPKLPDCQNQGYILRTRSRGKDEEEILAEAQYLYDIYQRMLSRQKYSRVGETLYSAGSGLSKLITNLPEEELEKIVVDDAHLLEQLKGEILPQRPKLTDRFELYQDTKWPIFDMYKVSSQLQKAAQKQIMVQGGGYLFIEETEALTAIDVNTGQGVQRRAKEENMRNFNLKVVPIIVQQIMLRNLAGIIIIDFIDMKRPESRKQVLDALVKEFTKDRRATQVFGFTQLGLMEISRERQGVSLSTRMREKRHAR